MKLIRVATVVFIAAMSFGSFAPVVGSGVADSIQVQIASQDSTVRKALTVQKPKTNWSKIKELFM